MQCPSCDFEWLPHFDVGYDPDKAREAGELARALLTARLAVDDDVESSEKDVMVLLAECTVRALTDADIAYHLLRWTITLAGYGFAWAAQETGRPFVEKREPLDLFREIAPALSEPPFG